MKRFSLSSLLFLLVGTSPIRAGEALYWLSLGHSRYLLTPGLDFSYQFKPRLGFNLGLAMYIQQPDHLQLSNQSFEARTGFHQANLGLSAYFFQNAEHGLGLIAGYKLYYGPDYRILHFDARSQKQIYFDASILKPESGLDMGIFYRYRKCSILIKFDLARKRARIGCSYLFCSRSC